jgi:hypothetical protein
LVNEGLERAAVRVGQDADSVIASANGDPLAGVRVGLG